MFFIDFEIEPPTYACHTDSATVHQAMHTGEKCLKTNFMHIEGDKIRGIVQINLGIHGITRFVMFDD